MVFIKRKEIFSRVIVAHLLYICSRKVVQSTPETLVRWDMSSLSSLEGLSLVLVDVRLLQYSLPLWPPICFRFGTDALLTLARWLCSRIGCDGNWKTRGTWRQIHCILYHDGYRMNINASLTFDFTSVFMKSKLEDIPVYWIPVL